MIIDRIEAFPLTIPFGTGAALPGPSGPPW